MAEPVHGQQGARTEQFRSADSMMHKQGQRNTGILYVKDVTAHIDILKFLPDIRYYVSRSSDLDTTL